MYAYAPQTPRQEMTFFAGPGIQVTSARFVVGAQMYPIAAITSVSPFTIPAKRVGLFAIGGFCSLIAVGCIGTLVQSGNPFGLLVFAVIAGLCIWRAIARKDVHGVGIFTSGMQVRALTSEDVALVHQVVAALHQAVAAR